MLNGGATVAVVVARNARAKSDLSNLLLMHAAQVHWPVARATASSFVNLPTDRSIDVCLFVFSGLLQ